MALTIGRVTDTRFLSTVQSVNITQDQISLSGLTTRADNATLTIDDIKAFRDQMAALVNNPDEPIVPLVMTAPHDASLTQFVRPRSASVTMDKGCLERGAFPWSFTADRLPSGFLPRVEKTLSGEVRTNNLSVVLADLLPYDSYPTSANAYAFDTRIDAIVTRVGPGASMNHLYSGTAYMPGTTLFAQMTQSPAGYYDGAAYIKDNGRLVNGRLYPSSPLNVANWEIGNGLFKLQPGSGTAMLKLTLPVFATPTVWGTPILLDLGRWSTVGPVWAPSPITDIENVSILRNSPEFCVLRLHIGIATGTAGSTYITADITVRRGDRGATVTVKCPWTGGQWGVGYNAATATTTVTVHANNCGINRAAADGDGNKVMFLASSILGTLDNVNGRFYMTATDVRTFGIYGVIGGAGAAAQDTGLTLLSQYYAAQVEVQRVIGT